jgi:aminocarboxymuconate-semialdehyde decarboxylase
MGFIKGGEERGTAADMFRRHYWDTALAASDPVLRMLQDVAGMDRVLYGTDFPYLRRDLAVKTKQQIERWPILGKNAAQLLPRFRKS